ncbi:MAG: superoxide dismutase [archaeon]
MKHTLPELDYSYNALEPFIDETTMKIHHTKHHQAYIDKLNTALDAYPELQKKEIKELLANIESVPEKIRAAVRNHGGGHYNHSFFWKILKKSSIPKGEINKEIEKTFGSFDLFKTEFSNAAISIFGSGWQWLVLDKGKLALISIQNQDSPLSLGKTPIIGLDVWEHAYYLKYQNKRADYISAFFNVINWTEIDSIYQNAKTKA